MKDIIEVQLISSNKDFNLINALKLFTAKGNVRQKPPGVITPFEVSLSITSHYFVLLRCFLS